MRFYFIFLIIATTIFIVSCEKKVTQFHNEEARQLFEESASLISKYTDEIKIAPDSASVDSLNERFEKKITEINFHYPSETDLNMTEQENDSLFNLLSNLKQVTTIRLQELKKTDNDTIPMDTFHGRISCKMRKI